MNLERKQRAPARSIIDQYDAYLDASEEHTFGKLRANLQRMERKAEREHNNLKDAAGISAEARRARGDAKVDGRREKSPARYAARDAARLHHAGNSSSVASLIQQPDQRDPYAANYGQRAPSPRAQSPRPASGGGHGAGFRLPTGPQGGGGGDQTDRSYGGDTERARWGGGGEYARGRAPSPRPMRPGSPRQQQQYAPRPASPRRAASPRPQQHHPEAPRAQSPFRMRPEAQQQ